MSSRRNLPDPPAPAPADRPGGGPARPLAVTLAPEASPVGQPSVWWRLEDLDPWQENPRLYGKDVVGRLADLIALHGFNTVINCHWPTRRIIRGHRRRLALQELFRRDPEWQIEGSPGPGYVPVRFTGGPWEAAERDALADNRAQEDGAWDLDQVGRLVERWTAEGDDLAAIAAATAFGDQEIREILAQVQPERKRAADVPAPPCPAPPREPDSRKGEVYQLGPHRLICGDTTSLDDLAKLMGGDMADAVVTDPPFAIYGSSTGLDASIADDKVIRPFFRDVLAGVLAVVRPFGQVYVCCDWRSWASWWEAAQRVKLHPSNMLIWDKGNAGLGSQWANGYEVVGFFTAKPVQTKMFRGKATGTRMVLRPNILRDFAPEDADDGPARVDLVDLEAMGEAGELPPEGRRALLRYGRTNGVERVHNAAKPIGLLTELITAATDPGGLVVDLFGGGGSTLLAAAQCERRAYLSEIDPLWCDVIRHRWTAWAAEAGVDPGPGALVLEGGLTVLGRGAPKGKGEKGKPARARKPRAGKGGQV